MDRDHEPRFHVQPLRLHHTGVAALLVIVLSAALAGGLQSARRTPGEEHLHATGPACGGSPPPSRPIWVSERRFKKVVLEAEVPVLVEFGAVWCLPCHKMVPALNSLATDFAGRALVVRVDIDQDRYLAQDLGVDSLPMTILFHDGRPVRRLVGSRSRADLGRLLDQILVELDAPPRTEEAAAAAG